MQEESPVFDIRTMDWNGWLKRQSGVRYGSMHVFREAIGYALYAVINVNGNASVVNSLWQPKGITPHETKVSFERLQNMLQARVHELVCSGEK